MEPTAKRKRYFENEMFEKLIASGCNPQWHDLLEKCQKNGSTNDASNLIKTIELFLASEEIDKNPSEYPVDFICKHGDLDTFKTFISLSEFDLDVNQPILTNKLTPYAADCDNVPIVTYLITKMDMEFRINLLEKSLSQRDKKLPKLLQPFLPLDYSKSIPEEDDINFFLKAGNRFMQEIFSPDSNFDVISSHIISFLDLRSLFAVRSVSKSFKHVIDQKFQHWTNIYLQEKAALLEKLAKIEKNMEDFKPHIPPNQNVVFERLEARGDSAYITFFISEWRKIIEHVEDLNRLEKIKMLIKRYHILNKNDKNDSLRVIPCHESRMWFSWLSHQKRALISPIMFCIGNKDVEMMKLIIPIVNSTTHLTKMGRQEMPLIHRIVKSGQFEMVKLVARHSPFIDLEARDIRDGRNALHIAAQEGNLLIFQMLLASAKFNNPRDDTGATPYKLASEEIKEHLKMLYRSGIIEWLE